VAKGKSNSSPKAQSNSSSKRKTAPSNKNEQAIATKPTDELPAISNEQIGHVAGDLWHFLHREGGQSLSAIKKAMGAPSELILAAIGWLAREDKLAFTTSGRTVKISLR
jgi:Winged helix-turn-helix domain (DUF2582)